jgi:hypothetical protein
MQNNPCDIVLLQRTQSNTAEDYQFRCAWLSLITKDNYEEMKHSADATIYEDIFDGSYDDFLQKRSNYFAFHNYSASVDDSRQEVRVELPEGAVKAWSDCVNGNAQGLYYYLVLTEKVCS